MLPNKDTCAYRALRIASVMAISCFTVLPAQAQSQKHNVTLDAGTVIPIRLQQALSSNESNRGDRFTATVQDSDKDFPSGTKIEGTVLNAQPKQDKHPGVLELAFQRAVLPDGRSYSINGSLIGLDNKSVTHDKQGRLIATKTHRTNRLTFVGYGAGAGLVVGLLADKKNTLRDTAIGAGLGYLYGALEKGRSNVSDVNLKEGAQLGVRLDRRLGYARTASATGR
jgi:hypothetical protein